MGTDNKGEGRDVLKGPGDARLAEAGLGVPGEEARLCSLGDPFLRATVNTPFGDRHDQSHVRRKSGNFWLEKNGMA